MIEHFDSLTIMVLKTKQVDTTIASKSNLRFVYHGRRKHISFHRLKNIAERDKNRFHYMALSISNRCTRPISDEYKVSSN